MDQLQISDLKTANGKDRLRILHVDDDPCILEDSKSILEMEGNFEVDTALSVDEAFRKMEQQTYDAVISDYEMPQKNGLNFLAELRGKRNKIPFILFTGKGREEVAIKALNLGANYYLNKVGSPETMYGELAHAIETAVRAVRVESALKASEERFRAVFEGASDGVLGADPETKRLVLANPTMCKLTGYSLDELTKLGVGDIHPKKDLPHVLDEFEKQLKGEIALALDIPVLKKDGQVVYCDVNSKLVTIENRKVMAGFFRDTTERKRAEENLRQSEEKYRGLFESTQDGIIISDAQGVVASANQAAGAMLGYKNAEELANVPAETLYEDPEDRRVLFELLAKKGTVKDYEVKLKRKDGETFDVRMTVALQRDLQGKVLRSEAIFRDITERKHMKKVLEESEERLRNIIESSSDQIFLLDRDFRFLSINKVAAGLFGMSPEEMVGRSISEVFPETIAAQFSKNIKNVFDSGESMFIDERMVAEGRESYHSTSLNPVRDDSGRVRAVTGIVRDITESKRAEKRLQESEERFRAVFEGANDGILVVDVKTKRFFFANPRICKITGYSSEELLKLGVSDIHHKKDLPYVIDSFTKQMKGEISLSMNIPVLRKDGRVVYCDVNSKPIKIGSQECLVGLFRDATERREAEEKLKESEKKYETTFESSMDALMLLDEKGFFDCNKSTLVLFGCKSVEKFAKYHPADLSPPTQPDGSPSMEAAMNHINRAFKTGTDSFLWIHRRIDGTTFPADVLLTRMPLKDRNVLQGTVRDITQRKEAEELLKENSDRIEMMNEKLRVVGGLTRHDVRNKLSAVTGYAYLLKKKHADQADIIDGLGKMEQAVKDVVKIFDFAKMYEQLGVEELTYVDVEKVVNEAVALFSGLTIKVVNGCHGLTVLADSFLRQLFYNFIDNTRKYGEKTTAARVYFEKAESGELRLICEDDGVGISAEDKLKLFTEGFSTGGSTGFGLFLIKKMMDVYGWQIQEAGEPGKGAKFVITIPRVNQGGKENFQIA